MSAKFYSKKIQKKCLWCIHAVKSDCTDDIFCKKRGVTKQDDLCRHYKYDVLKRVPDRIKPSDNYNPEDFKV